MTKNWQEHYERWNEFASLDPELHRQLTELKTDEKNLEDSFYKPIEFGTGGMRGIMGPGINRINIYTIRKATSGLAQHLLEQQADASDLRVVIAYDSRTDSHKFAIETAKVFGHYRIRAILFEQLCPTPILSFAVRHLGACAGVVITASHNPPEYNGYKIYGSDGGQIPPQVASRIFEKIEQVKDELLIETSEVSELLENGILHFIGEEVFDAYMACQEKLRFPKAVHAVRSHQPRIVFSPLHGTTHNPIVSGLKSLGFNQVRVVQEQAEPHPLFPTVSSPNPEDPEAFRLALKYARNKGADLIICTDPDGDRLGVAVRSSPNHHVILTGNQVGILLLDYILSQKQSEGAILANSVVVKTIVTSEMVRTLAAEYDVDTVDTLTGFKYIGEKMAEYEQTGQFTYLFGLEESCGYLYGDFVRDKDAVQAAFLLADACANQLSFGSSLYQRLQDLYAKYGYYREDLVSITYPGKDGMEKMTAILASLRDQPIMTVGTHPITTIEDYLRGTRRILASDDSSSLTLPASDVMKFYVGDAAWFCIRPSGTEPKIKLYFGVKANSHETSQLALKQTKRAVLEYFHRQLPT